MSFPKAVEISPNSVVSLDERRLLTMWRMKADADDRPRRPHDIEEIRGWLSSADLRLVGDTAAFPAPLSFAPDAAFVANHSEGYLWVEDTRGKDLDDDRLKTLAHAAGDALHEMAPVYRGGSHSTEAEVALLPHVLVIDPRAGVSPGKLADVLESYGLGVDKERSRYLGSLLYCTVKPGGQHTAFTLRPALLEKHPTLVRRVLFEQLPFERPLAFLPSDAEWSRQWNLDRVGATSAWDVTKGAGVVVAIFDSGCQLDHPDLTFRSGFNADDLRRDGSPVRGADGRRSAHGTSVAGIVGARLNTIGVAGLAGEADLLPIASATFSDVAVAAGIRFAAEHGARVINMSFATIYLEFWTGLIPSAIEYASRRGCVLCAASGNADARRLFIPAVHPLVLAVGGSNRADERWSIDTPSSGRRGANYGDEFTRGTWTGVSVIAPADRLPTTDLVGVESANPPGSALHGYTLNFWETSAATAHASAVAALLLSQYPSRPPAEVGRIIEQSAEKVGSLPYAYADGFYSGTRHEQMGYGRLHAYRALRMADIYIRDWPEDPGNEPSDPPRGDFFTSSGIVIRPGDDGVFLPGEAESSILAPGADHTIYVQVSNRGPSIAGAIAVDVRITPFVGLEFHYPDDWTAEDDLHIRPAAVRMPPTLTSGESGMAAFTLSAADVDRAAGWVGMRWHPCALAVTSSIADDAFDPDSIDARHVVTRFNNLAQRNLSVLRTRMESLEWFPFAVGHPKNLSPEIDLVIEVDPRLAGAIRLWLAGSGQPMPAAATADMSTPSGQSPSGDLACRGGSLVFLDRTRVLTTFGGCCGELTLEKGSRFDARHATIAASRVTGGVAGGDGERRWVDLKGATARITLQRSPGRRQWLALETRIPADVVAGETLAIRLTQMHGNVPVGGATVRYVVE